MASVAATTVQPERLPLSTRLLFGSGSILNGANGRLMGMLLLFYTQIAGLPPQMASLALSISLFADAFFDPLLGQFSDNLRTRMGRRHPLMYASVIPIVIFMILLWNPPHGLSDWMLFTYLVTVVVLLRFSTSLFDVPNGALVPELAPDYHQRTDLMSFRYVFLTLGALIALVLAYGVFLKDTPEFRQGQLNPAGYGPLSFAIAGIVAVTVLVCSFGTQNRIAALHVPPVRRPSLIETGKDIIATLSNWNFGIAITAGLIFGVSTGISGGLQLFFSTYFWDLNSREILLLGLSALISTPIAAVIAPLLSRMWGKRRACMTLFFIAVAIGNSPILLRLLGFFPGNDSHWLLPILVLDQVATGILGTGGFIIVTSMIADIVEDSQTKTGRRSEGLLFSTDTLLQKVASSMTTLIPGLLLAWVGFHRGMNPQTMDPQIMIRLAWIYLPLTVVLSLASITCWSFYRIDKEGHERNLEMIRQAASTADALLEGGGIDGTAPEMGAPAART